MANRNFNRFQALEKEVKSLYAVITIGATGAPTLVAAQSMGVQSVTRVSAGLYDIVLQDRYMRLMSVAVTIVAPTAESIGAQVVSNTVSTAKNIRIRTQAAGVATDPANGDSLLLKIDVKNSSV